jgi:hypothetical protein
MNGQLIAVHPRKYVTALTLSLLLIAGSALAQVPVDENGNPVGTWTGESERSGPDAGPGDTPFSATELADLVGPVALYPDDLLAIVLPASTYPLEIVQAARFLDELENDASLNPDEDWDDSVVALLNYPDVVRMMNDDIDWTWRLGEAVISQQDDVIAAVEGFRDRAYAAGNLKTDERQKVSYDDGVIEIVPVNEEIIYVPYYEPAEVIVRQARPVYYYYPDPYPVYYYPYPVGYRFHSRYFWGVTTAFTIGWPNRYLHVHHPSYWGHPYYGRYYYGHYYRRPSITVYNNWYVNNRYRTPRHRYRDGDYWRPRHRAGARQYEQRVINRHYTAGDSRYTRSRSNQRRDNVRAVNNGRMNLNLRERGSNRGATERTRREARAANRSTSVRSRPQSVARNDRSNRPANANRAAERDRRDLTTHEARSRTTPNRAAPVAARSDTTRRAPREATVSRRPNGNANRAANRNQQRAAAPTRSRVTDSPRSAPSASRQRTRASQGRESAGPSRRDGGSRKRSRQRN